MTTATGPTTGVAPESVPFRQQPFRFKLGVGLLVLYLLMYLVAAVVPFLPLDVVTKAAIVAGDVAAAEVVLVLAVICVGKETFQAIKARLLKRKTGAPAAREE